MPKVSIGSLKLTVSSRTENVERNLKILQAFMTTIPIVIRRLAAGTEYLAKYIAPVSKEPELTSEQKKKAWETNVKRKPKQRKLVDTIRLGRVSKDGFTIEAGGAGVTGIKAVMQEFGYPYDNWYGPYEPNPTPSKNPSARRLKGLGYLRVSMIIAARNLNIDLFDINVNVTKSDVVNYEKRVTDSLNSTLRNFAQQFARGDLRKLPKWYKSKVQLPPERVEANVSRFGTFKGLKLNIPLAVDINNSVVNGLQFKGVTSSKSGRSQVSSSASFLI